MQHFYDGQIRRYITQIVRMMSNFSYKDSKGKLTEIPVTYGDLTRQVGSILRDNSENKIPSAPRMAVYITGLEMDTARLGDSSYVNKLNIRERAYDTDGNEYLNKEGKNYTVERLMPTPYTLSVNVDLWTTNTDQKLQILEQILILFNPSFEIQTTDNYIDWTSLTVVNLENLTFSSRSIPVGTESEIDVATIGFTTPVYISPPAKIKKLGVISNIVTSIFNNTAGDVDLETEATTLGSPGATVRPKVVVVPTGEISSVQTKEALSRGSADLVIGVAHNSPGLLVMNNTIQLVYKGRPGGEDWISYLKALPSLYEPGITEIRLSRNDLPNEIVGTIAVNTSDPKYAIVNWDVDTIPSDTIISGPSGDRSKIDYIIDPTRSNPQELGLSNNPRILLLGDIGNIINEDGADAWKNLDGTDFIANANDIVEWDGSKWHIVFDASTQTDVVYTTNLNTGVQYKWDTGEWILSFEGEYPNGAWRLQF